MTCIESNLRFPLTLFALAMGPMLLYFYITIFGIKTCPLFTIQVDQVQKYKVHHIVFGIN